MISMRLRRLYFRLSYLTGFTRDLRPGMQGFVPFSSRASLNQSASYPRSQYPLCCGKTVQQGRGTGIIADLSGCHEEAQRSSVLIRDRMQLRIHATFGPTDQAPWIPFFNRRLEAVRCALRYVASIIIV